MLFLLLLFFNKSDSSYVTKTRLFMSVLGCLKILFKEPDMLIKTMTKETSNRIMLKQFVEKALASSPIQTTYEELELEVCFTYHLSLIYFCTSFFHN